MLIGRAFKVLRTFHGLQQKDLSNKLGISGSYLSELESEKKVPTIQLLEAYSRVFDVKIWSIFFLAEWLDNPSEDSVPCPKIQQMINLLKIV